MKLGARGEETAAAYLLSLGYSIVERNFSCRIGELDLVAIDGDTFVFVEVKTRRSLRYGLPCESVTETKKHHILRTVKYYMMVRKLEGRDLRIDVLEVLFRGGTAYIRHIKNAFEGG